MGPGSNSSPALLHAEPVLLVDHHQAQVGELHLLLEQRVGADHDPGRARRRLGQRARAAPRRPATRSAARRRVAVLGAAELLRLAPAARACSVIDR